MSRALKVFVIAGEASGDRLGAALMAGLKDLTGGAVEFRGIGGGQMAAEGLESLVPMEGLSIMGLVEVLPKVPQMLRLIRDTGDAVADWRPDALVTIDSPDFGLRVAKRVKGMAPGVRRIHYVAPSVWAWRPGRAVKMAKVIEHVLALLPFEPPYMEAHGMSCDFVGHPVVAERQASAAEAATFRRAFGIGAEAPLLTVLPGSRRGEIGRLAPVFRDVVARVRAELPSLRVVVPAVGHLVPELEAVFGGEGVVLLDPREASPEAAEARKRACFAASDLALAASGTVSLELAAAGVPMVIAYRSNPVTEAIAKRLALIDTVTLVNLLTETRAVPEFLMEKCRIELIAPKVLELLRDPKARMEQAAAGARAIDSLGRGGKAPGLRAARSVLSAISSS